MALAAAPTFPDSLGRTNTKRTDTGKYTAVMRFGGLTASTQSSQHGQVNTIKSTRSNGQTKGQTTLT
jgi:hypothetical protein